MKKLVKKKKSGLIKLVTGGWNFSNNSFWYRGQKSKKPVKIKTNHKKTSRKKSILYKIQGRELSLAAAILGSGFLLGVIILIVLSLVFYPSFKIISEYSQYPKNTYLKLLLQLKSYQLGGASQQISEKPNCQVVKIGDVGWADNSLSNSVMIELLQAIGYKTENRLMPISNIMNAVANNRLDLFLGYWSPSYDPEISRYTNKGEIEILRNFIADARFTLATTRHAYWAGLRNFSDIIKFQEQLGGVVYGEEIGSFGSRLLRQYLDDNSIRGFSVYSISEDELLYHLKNNNQSFMVFVGYTPSPIFAEFSLRFLSGGDDYFGIDFGRNDIKTIVRKDFAQDCGNVYRLLQQAYLPISDINQMLKLIQIDKIPEKQVVHQYWQEHNLLLQKWLRGVKTWDNVTGNVSSGADGSAIAKANTYFLKK